MTVMELDRKLHSAELSLANAVDALRKLNPVIALEAIQQASGTIAESREQLKRLHAA